jgi:hypothetical protein
LTRASTSTFHQSRATRSRIPSISSSVMGGDAGRHGPIDGPCGRRNSAAPVTCDFAEAQARVSGAARISASRVSTVWSRLRWQRARRASAR